MDMPSGSCCSIKGGLRLHFDTPRALLKYTEHTKWLLCVSLLTVYIKSKLKETIDICFGKDGVDILFPISVSTTKSPGHYVLNKHKKTVKGRERKVDWLRTKGAK